MYEISLKNGTVISGAGTRKQDVLVEGEKIIKVGEELSQPDAKVVDVSGKLLFPGFIDGHTHFDLEVAGTEQQMIRDRNKSGNPWRNHSGY